jgi:D-alanyl-lipoteichoic acid acyltransferase DltB (MBOAT superfamily)
VGLAKKVLLADPLGEWVRAGFEEATPAVPSFFDSWLTALAYTFQIYFDFSGYTDMAIGAALLFNVRLPFNFNSPYHARDIQAFWRRWHITLGTFFRDYVYIPLGGNRLGRGRTLAHLFGVALISGLWHGAAWSFVIWGGLHGAAMVIHHLWKGTGWKLPGFVAAAVMFIFIAVTWVPFRAGTPAQAAHLLRGMVAANGISLPHEWKPERKAVGRFLKRHGVTWSGLASSRPAELFAYLFVAVVVVAWPRNSNSLADPAFAVPAWWLAVIGLLAAWSILNLDRLSEFIYFNF